MISALVIAQGEDKPGPGFWAFAVGLGKFAWGEDEDQFWRDELKRVWDYWSRNRSTK